MAMKKRAKSKRRTPTRAERIGNAKLPFIQHVYELRRRLVYVALCVTVGSLAAYSVQQHVISLLLRPSHGQKFIYTSPLGGINFLFGVCLDIGLVLATPVIIYNALAFLSPLMRTTTHRFLLGASAAAAIVACAGVLFGYYIGLPNALKFLLHQFTTLQVRPLLTIQAYVQFVALYLLGSALMFQLPLILLIINRIKPLKPQRLFRYERHLIVGAFVAAFIMDPSPNIVGQLVVVVPVIAMYQVGIALVWLVNRSSNPLHLQRLLEEDAQRQAERVARTRALVP